jgi:hypothetical protein
MDEAKTRDLISEHAQAIVRGGVEAVLDDFSEDLRPQLPQLAQDLPQPVKAADVLSVEVGDNEAVAVIRYTGDSGEATFRSYWREQDGRPVIVAADHVD